MISHRKPRVVILDLDRCISSAKYPMFLYEKLVTEIKALGPHIEAIIFCTHRYIRIHAEFLADAFNLWSSSGAENLKFEHCFTSNLVNNFRKATGLNKIPFLVSTNDDEKKCGAGYEKYMKPWEEKILQKGLDTYRVDGRFEFPRGYQSSPTYKSIGKNNQIRLCIEWAEKILKTSLNQDGDIYYYDDILALGLMTYYSHHLAKIVNFYHVKQETDTIKYIPPMEEPLIELKESITPDPTLKLKAHKNTPTSLIDDVYTKQCFRLINIKFPKKNDKETSAFIREFSAKLREDTLNLPDDLLLPFLLQRVHKSWCGFYSKPEIFFHKSSFEKHLEIQYLTDALKVHQEIPKYPS